MHRSDEPPADPSPRRLSLSSLVRERPLAERVSALKERVYASFTGLAIVTVFALDPAHTTAKDAFLALLAGIVGITVAGLAAEIISHLVAHRGVPNRSELGTMARIAAGAIGSASIPLIALCSAWLGLFGLQIALQVSVGIYLLTLGLIAFAAAYRTRLPWRQQVAALCGLVGLGAAVVGVLVVAH